MIDLQFTTKSMIAGLGIYAAVVPNAFAQAQTDASKPKLEEVVVTAQRREQSLQDVPISIVALTSEDLAKRQIKDMWSVQGTAPNVFIGQGLGDPTDLAIGIRGLTQTTAQSVTDPTIGMYVDGVYRARTSGSNVAFIDMDRVEVLRGPQGTLFGRNTIGGAFNVTTKKPTDQLEGSVAVDLGNYDTKNFTGIVNVPLVSKLATRLVYQHAEHSGYAQNQYLGKDENDQKQDYVRSSFLFSPNDDWEAELSADYLHVSAGQQLFKAFWYNSALPANASVPAANPGVPAAPGQTGPNRVSNWTNIGGFYDNYSQLDARFKLDAVDVTGIVNGKIGDVNVKSITGYREEYAKRPADFDGTPYPYLENPIKPFQYHQFSEELQAYGNLFNDRLDYIFGAYYFTEEDRMGQETVRLAPGPAAALADTIADNKSLGAFTQFTYHFTDRLSATAGVRFTTDTRSATYLDRNVQTVSPFATLCGLSWAGDPDALTPIAPNSPASATCELNTGDVSHHYRPFTLGIDYKPEDDVLLYAKMSRGFRSGGFPQSGNAIVGPQPAAQQLLAGFGPENITSWELGAKLEMLERKLRLNAATFVSYYNDIQQSSNDVVSINGVPTIITNTLNVGKAKIWGGELELNALLGAGEVHAAIGYANPKYTEVGTSLAGTGGTDTPFINVSDVTYSVGADYPFHLGVGQLTASVNCVYQSKMRFAIVNPAAADRNAAQDALNQDGYGLLNAKLSLDLDQAPVTIALWGRNLTDEEYKTRAADFSPAPFGLVAGTVGDPRTYGVSAEYRF